MKGELIPNDQVPHFIHETIAPLLKELGFIDPCMACFNHNWDLVWNIGNSNSEPFQMSAPTWSHVFDWLRYKKGILITTIPRTSGKHYYEVWRWMDDGHYWNQINPLKLQPADDLTKEPEKWVDVTRADMSNRITALKYTLTAIIKDKLMSYGT